MAALNFDINLLATGDNKPLNRFLHWSLSYGRYIIIGTQIIVLLAFFSRFKLDRDLSDLQTRIEEKTNILQALNPVETEVRNLQTKIGILGKLEESRTFYSLVMDFFAQNNPSGIVVSQISLNDDDLLLVGKALSNGSFNNFLSVVKKEDMFIEIAIAEVNQSRVDGVISFRINMKLQKPTETVKKTASLINK